MKKKFGDFGGGLLRSKNAREGIHRSLSLSRKATQQLVAVLSNQNFLAPVESTQRGKMGYTLWWTNIAMENHHF